MELIVDRIENNQIVFELPDKSHVNIPLQLLQNAKENEVYNLTLNKEETTNKINKVHNLMDELFK